VASTNAPHLLEIYCCYVVIDVCRIRPEPMTNGSGSVRVLHVNGFGSVRFYIFFFCMTVLVLFGSAKMWVLDRFVRFDSHL